MRKLSGFSNGFLRLRSQFACRTIMGPEYVLTLCVWPPSILRESSRVSQTTLLLCTTALKFRATTLKLWTRTLKFHTTTLKSCRTALKFRTTTLKLWATTLKSCAIALKCRTKAKNLLENWFLFTNGAEIMRKKPLFYEKPAIFRDFSKKLVRFLFVWEIL